MPKSLADAALRPVSARVTVADSVYQNLRQALILGRFDPGQVLTIGALADSFQTSHMPVREALRRLGAEGAVEIRSNGSAYVPDVTLGTLEDISRARLALEGLATELAVERITETDLCALEELEARHSATARLRDVYEMLERNCDFHFAIYATADSPVLMNLIESLWLRYGPFMRLLSQRIAPQFERGTHEPFQQGHRDIVEAIRARDPARARAAICRDIEGTKQLLVQICAEK
ncbi:GntR family transcriptional regulator [Pararhodobacter sp.]|jgi:DNA-binding GntR family transcriptional regulator|uniref:GntR family transcriptional regulator n=1 Tax=Pararhodobacter sp. TaxID=2127056 RepID=UPI002FDC8E82